MSNMKIACFHILYVLCNYMTNVVKVDEIREELPTSHCVT